MATVSIGDTGGGAVDTNAIAAAVAGALSIPTANQNAAATAASGAMATTIQTASEAAITAKISAIQSGLATASAVSTLQTTCSALPSASAIATAVGAQAACAAALTAAAGAAIPSVAQNQSGLATSSALSTLQTAVDALPDTAAIQAAAVAAIQAEAGQFGSIRGLVDPATYLITTGEITGTTDHLLQFFQLNKRCVVWGFVITSDTAVTLQWRSGIGVTIGDAHALAVNVPWVVAPNAKKTYRFNTEEALFLLSSVSKAKLHMTYWFSYEDF